MFQRFASICPRPNLRPACREASARREGGGLGWGKVMCLLGKRDAEEEMPRPYKAKRLGDTRATHLVWEGISPLGLRSGTWRAGTEDFSGQREETAIITRYDEQRCYYTQKRQGSETRRVTPQGETHQATRRRRQRCHRRRARCLHVFKYIITMTCGKNNSAHHNRAVI